MTYKELVNKTIGLVEQGKSEEEIVELLGDDIKQAAEYCLKNPEELTTPMKDLLNSCDSESPMVKLLFRIMGTNMFNKK